MAERRALPQEADRLFLTDGGIETSLIFDEGYDLPSFAAFYLLHSGSGREALTGYFERYLAIAIATASSFGFVLESPTWRANPDWADRLGYSKAELAASNTDAIGLMQRLRRRYEGPDTPILVSGCVGPRGDAYVVTNVMRPETAEAYHDEQTAVMAAAGIDLVTALTMTNVPEAIGVARSAARRGIPSVIFLHGVTDSWRSFERVLPLLPAHVHAFAVSARGHGDSSRPERGYLLSDMSSDLLAFMDTVGLERALIVGHSMGAMVAQRFAMDHPSRVSGLVLMGAFATLFQDPGLMDFYRSAIAPLADPIDAGFAREWQQSTLARPMAADHLDTVVGESLKVPARIWREAFEGFLATPDFSADLSRVGVPTLVIWGDKDSYAPREHQDRLVSRLPKARLVVYEGAGHAVHWEDPAAFVKDLKAFIESLPARPPTPSAAQR